MSSSESPDEPEVEVVAPAEDAAEDPATAAEPAPEAVETRTRVEVGLVRSVRYLRVMIGAAAVGAVLAAVAALFFPVPSDADYELGQVVGLMLVAGAAIGLALGAVLALILGRIARRDRGAALAVQVDVS